jgi:tetratricopeptide (TPR) repeat protein
MRQFDKAIEDYHRAINLDPHGVDPYWCLGKLFTETGQPEKAMENYNKAIAIDPNADVPYVG